MRTLLSTCIALSFAIAAAAACGAFGAAERQSSSDDAPPSSDASGVETSAEDEDGDESDTGIAVLGDAANECGLDGSTCRGDDDCCSLLECTTDHVCAPPPVLLDGGCIGAGRPCVDEAQCCNKDGCVKGSGGRILCR